MLPTENPEPSQAAIRALQDEAFRKNFGEARKLIVFVNFPENDFCGGVMAIFHLANISRRMKAIHGCEVLHANLTSRAGNVYLRQPRFENAETLYRFSQVLEHAPHLDTLIFHVPELLMEEFASGFSLRERQILQNVPDLQINVLNQNLEVFCPPETWGSLWELTRNITQTTNFDRYTTQETCDRFGLPLYRLIGFNPLYRAYAWVPRADKEMLFTYSLDPHPMKEAVLRILAYELPEFRFQQIQELTFDAYMRLTQKAMFNLTFGEGWDWYFTDIHFVGGIGFAVYNETFFPSPEFRSLPTIYESYERLAQDIARDVRHLMGDPRLYEDLSRQVAALNSTHAINEDLTYGLMEKFYRKEPTFLPRCPGWTLAGTGDEPSGPAAPEAFLLAPGWAEGPWIELLICYFAAFAPGDPVALVVPLFDGKGPEENRKAVVEAITAAGRETFPDVLLLDHPDECLDALRPFMHLHALDTTGPLPGGPAGSPAWKFALAYRNLQRESHG